MKNKELNKSIVKAILSGSAISDAARTFGTSEQNARAVLHRECERVNEAVYIAGIGELREQVSPSLSYLRRKKEFFMPEMKNLDNLKSKIKDQIKELMDSAISDVDFINLNAYEKVKADPYCCYNVAKESFYLSTTEDDSFDDYIKFDDVIDLFIESYGGAGDLSNEAADKFIAKLSGAIEKITKAKGDYDL